MKNKTLTTYNTYTRYSIRACNNSLPYLYTYLSNHTYKIDKDVFMYYMVGQSIMLAMYTNPYRNKLLNSRYNKY